MNANNSSLIVPQYVAVLRLSAIGDVVLCASMVMHLAKYSKYKVFWITTRQTKELLGELPNVEYIIVPKPKNFKTFLECRRILKGYTFDFLLLAQASFSAHFVGINVKSKRKIGFDSRRSKDLHGFFIKDRIPYNEQHFVDAYYSFSAKVGLPPPESPNWEVFFKSSSLEKCSHFGLPKGKLLLAVNPSSSKKERNWDIDSYVAVINHAQNIGLNVVITGGHESSEIKFNQIIVSKCKIPPLDLTGKIQLSELPYLIKSCDVLMAPDTGAVHIATAIGIPVIGLYAVANPQLTGPYRALQFSVDRYQQATEKFSNSQKLSFFGRIHDSRSMSLITVKDVVSKLDQVILHISARKKP